MITIRVLIVDDHAMVREGLKSLLEHEIGIQVVGEAATGYEAIKRASETSPHVVVMDAALPDLNGIEATARILKQHPHMKAVVISAHAVRAYINGALQAGASAFLLKRSAADELVRAVRLVADGKTYLSPEIAGGIVEEHLRAHPSPTRGTGMAGLTGREREMLQLLSEGNTAKEMAAMLHVSVKTIETHRRNVMQKLNLHSVAELTRYALREGITSPDF